jgi:DNA-binding NarL/FixJ family response regulator
MRIMIVDDHALVSSGLRALLESRDGFEVVSEVGDGISAVERARELRPDLIVMDVALPHLSGIEAMRQILAEQPQARIIALTAHRDRHYMAEALKAGAAGYLLKEAAFEELLSAIATVMQGRTYLSSRIAGMVVDEYIRGKSDRNDPAPAVLTGRERQVLQLLSDGRSTNEAARNLGVSVKTIEAHRRQIMDKLNIRSQAALVKYAIREGLTTLES